MSWPEWKYVSKICCSECRKTFNILFIDLNSYCPHCWRNWKIKSELSYIPMRWISASIWYKPWTWFGGYWVDKEGGVWL